MRAELGGSPPDLKKLLRNPILAGLFLDLPYHSVQRAPRSEYEIFEAFWARIATKGRPGDEGIATALAAYFMDGQPYPLPRQRWHEVELSDDALARLDAAGWLRVEEDGAVAFAHDRLLNWAAAKALMWQHKRRQMTTESLASFLSNSSGDQDPSIRRRLGYVAMDMLWLLAEEAQNSEMLGSIVERMEDSREFGSYGEELYAHLLPTLGQRAVPILLERLNAIISGGSSDYRIRLIGRALANLARQDHVELGKAVGSLLRTASRDRQSVAIATLTATPDAAYLDRLWEIHQRRVDALEDKADGMRHEDYKASFAALRAGVARNPEWLSKRIQSADPEQEHVSELGYLLNGLEHADAPAIWKDRGDALMAKIPVNKPRSLLHCIARFGDRGKLDFVIQHLSQSEDFGSGTALYALSVLNPRAAIERLVEVGEAERSLTRNNWLPGLLRAEPDLTRQHVLALSKSEPKGRLAIETLFGQRPDELDEPLLRFVLRSLERDLREHLAAAIAGDPLWLHHPLSFLGRITRPDLLAILQAESGDELEQMITAVACSRLRVNSNWRDHVREDARRVLILIGGDGITTLLKQELESEHYWVRYGGLHWAFVRRDDGIIERLAAIARRPLPRDANGKPESEPYFEFHQAMNALAMLGADLVLVNVILDNGMSELPADLAELRALRGPMPKALTEKAAETLANEAAAERELQVALVVAWISGDGDFVPAVRGVLRRIRSRQAAWLDMPVSRSGNLAISRTNSRNSPIASLRQKKMRSSGLNALANLGDRGANLLMERLQSAGAASLTEHEGFVIGVLYAHPATRAHGVAAAVASCRRGRHFGDAPYDIAAEANDPVLRDQIVDKAFASRSFVVTEPLRAIEGLAKFDAPRAVDAIELALQSHPKIERQLCRLLVRVAPEIAAHRLVQAAMLSERDSLRSAIGQALRRLDPAVISPLIVDCMRGTVSERKAAAELAAWLPAPVFAEALGHLADRDSASEVRHAALLALEHHRQEASLLASLEEFRTASYDRRWSLLIAILETAEPCLLTDRDDPLWLGNIFSDEVPSAFQWHANKVLRQRKQKDL